MEDLHSHFPPLLPYTGGGFPVHHLIRGKIGSDWQDFSYDIVVVTMGNKVCGLCGVKLFFFI